MEAIFWIALLLNVAAKIEFVGSRGLKNQKGKSDVFSLSAMEIYFKITVCSRPQDHSF